MWNQPYLETCCRSALHRLHLAGAAGRPGGAADAGCLRRLACSGLCGVDERGRFAVTPAGADWHAAHVLGPRAVRPGAR
jgi:hypothetical protein